MQNNRFSIAVLGAGNIGSAVLTRLQELDVKVLKLDLKKVLVSDTSKDRGVSKDLLTDNFDDILNDDSIDLVIEVLGGVDPGKEYIKSLLQKGKAVITANKDIIADCGQELITLNGHDMRVWSAMYSPDGDRIVTASFDKTAKV